MTHTMRLDLSPFEMIADGTKTIELRLYDEKRRKLRQGDTIVFICTEDSTRTLEATVTALHIFDSFETLYAKLPLLRCGYTKDDIASAKAADMEAYYTRAQQEKYGVVGIEISLVK